MKLFKSINKKVKRMIVAGGVGVGVAALGLNLSEEQIALITSAVVALWS